MRGMLAICGTVAIIAFSSAPTLAQSAPPGQTVNVTPNQQTTQATATSNPSGQNISQQNNFYDPGSNAFGPGIQCSGPYLASSLYRNDSSNPGSVGSGFANVGGTIGIVVPLNGSNKKCQEFVSEILFQRQLDTCLSMMKQGFAFDPNGQYAALAKRCSGIHFTGKPISSANPVSPPQPPTVITVPASPSSVNVLPLPRGTGPHAQAPESGAAPPAVLAATPAVPVAPVQVAARNTVHITSLCQTIDAERKHTLIARFKAGKHRRTTLEELHAACIPDSEIMAAL
ncbi:MAG TPA: hypothetical protein VIK27_11470 [Candidatus Aquilonibacter sp.]